MFYLYFFVAELAWDGKASSVREKTYIVRCGKTKRASTIVSFVTSLRKTLPVIMTVTCCKPSKIFLLLVRAPLDGKAGPAPVAVLYFQADPKRLNAKKHATDRRASSIEFQIVKIRKSYFRAMISKNIRMQCSKWSFTFLRFCHEYKMVFHVFTFL